jgi:LmbE family N-acetylglucosaminyl deacetylase
MSERVTGTSDQRFPYRSVLAVCAHPDDESFGLGAVLSAFTELGIEIAVLCFTHGEASTLGETDRDLATVRAAELAAAARVLGVSSVRLLSYTDGALRHVALEELCREVERCAVADSVDCLLVFDEGGITGHRDHERATEAALVIAEQLGVPALAWALPTAVTATLNREFNTGFVGREPSEIDLVIEVDRRLQREAISCHASQAADNPVLWRRLELLADTESLRWLTSTRPAS